MKLSVFYDHITEACTQRKLPVQEVLKQVRDAGITGISVPSSIIGMLLLTFLLKVKVIKLEWVETISNFLVKNMGFFFVPPGVALMLYFDIIGKEIVPIVLATTLSTMLVLVVTGWTHIMTREWIEQPTMPTAIDA